MKLNKKMNKIYVFIIERRSVLFLFDKDLKNYELNDAMNVLPSYIEFRAFGLYIF